jgi:hypothetical protein
MYIVYVLCGVSVLSCSFCLHILVFIQMQYVWEFMLSTQINIYVIVLSIVYTIGYSPPGLLFSGCLVSFFGGGAWSSQGMRLTTRLHVVQRLRMSEDIPPLALCAFKACRMTTILLPFEAVLVE